MKTILQWAGAALFFTLTLLAGGCSKSGENTETGTQKADSAALSVDDFLAHMYDGCAGSIEIAKRAEVCNDLEVRKVGEKIVAENAQILQAIKTLSENKGVSLSDSLSTSSENALNKLSDKDGDKLATAVIRALLNEQRIISSTLRRYRTFDDTEVQAFMKENKDKFKEQAREIRAARKAIKDSKDDEQKPA